MFTPLDLILLRHADAQDSNSKNSFKLKQQYLENQKSSQLKPLTRIQRLKDGHISSTGAQQCKQIADTLNWENIGLIIVSPLRRCLDTCRMLLKFSQKNIQVLVQPLITDRITNAWSCGSCKNVLEKQYPEFSFSCLDNCQRLPWYLRILNNSTLKKIFSIKNPSEFYEYGIKQTEYQFRDRIQRFKKYLIYQLSRNPGKRILIISHNKVFSIMTAKFFTDQGKSVSDYKFSSGEIKYVKSCQLFHPLCPTPKF